MQTVDKRISLIAALAANGAIGYENRLLYWLPNDLKRFKALTTGHTILMGRRTFESLPKGALPHRRNLVLSGQEHPEWKGVERYASLQEALAHCGEEEEIFVIGGSSLYLQALPLAHRLCLTLVEDTPARADAFFPAWDKRAWKEIERDARPADEKHLFPYTFVNYERL